MEVKDSKSSGVCRYCRDTICEKGRLWGYHHSTLRQFEESVQSHCMLCHRLLQAVRSRYSDITHLQFPLYRWNVRCLTHLRDMQEIISVIFRPLENYQPLDVGDNGGVLPDLTFHFYREDDVDYVPEGTALGESTSSNQTWVQVRKWVEDCTTNHPMCRQSSQAQQLLPTRLLDIGAVKIDGSATGNVRVVDTKSQKIVGPYVTLSHSWGPNPTFIVMKADNQADLMNVGFSFDDPRLSKNFKEAILVARRLNVQYIWIDSFGILQKDAKDWQKEAPLMDQYYRNSFCNIAASDSFLPSEGLFRPRKVTDDSHPRIIARYVPEKRNGTFGSSSWLIIPADTWESELLQGPLYRRAWVFQERMLAPRLLHFSKHQVFFECATISACESLPSGLPRASGIRAATDRYWRQRLQLESRRSERPVSGTADLSIEDFWKTAVSTYTRCELTDWRDKIVALLGVARFVVNALPDAEHSFGLLNKRLEEQLAWRVVQSRQANGDASIRPKPSVFPSWSWASITGVIELRDRVPPVEREYCVLDHNQNTIKFEFDAYDYEIAVPEALLAAGSQTHVKQDNIKSFETEVGLVVSSQETLDSGITKESMTTKRWALKIQGYIRQGRLQLENPNQRVTLCTNDSEDLNCEVFPDEPLQDTLTYCCFMVLAYSRLVDTSASRHNSMQTRIKHGSHQSNSRQDQTRIGSPPMVSTPERQMSAEEMFPAHFSGIGLLLQEVDSHPSYYCRCGSFQFHHLTLTELAALTVVQDLHRGQKEKDQDEQPRNIFLC